MKFVAAVLSLSFLPACAVVIPVHEAEPPELLDNWGFRLGYIQGSAPAVAPLDTGVTAAKGNQALPLGGFRIAAGFLERLQFNLDSYVGLAAAGSSMAVKYQWNGDTYWKAKKGNAAQTSTVRFYSGASIGVSLNYNGDTLFDQSDIHSTGQDISHVWGYRFADSGGVYGGAKVTSGTVKADYRSEKDGPILYSSKRKYWGYGGLGGVFWSPHGKHVGFDLLFEIQALNLPDMYQDKRSFDVTYVFSLAMPFSFN